MPSTAQTILIIEDDPDVLDLVRLHLRKAGYLVAETNDGEEGLKKAREQQPAAIILDLMLPGIRGEEVCRRLKARPSTARIPIIMLTALGEAEDCVAGLELGADDYVSKPFSPRELILRLQAILQRRAGAGRSDKLEVGPVCLDRGDFSVQLNGRSLPLTGIEFRLLAALMENRGRAISRETLLRDVWGYHNLTNTRTVDTHMRRLRAKFKPYDDRLETVHGEGYRFAARETD